MPLKTPLRFGLPKGSLEQSTFELLARAGFKVQSSSRGYKPYINDPELAQWTDEAARELDADKRNALYAKIFNKVNDERYAMPLVEFPAILVTNKDIAIDSNHMKPEGFLLNRVSWQ